MHASVRTLPALALGIVVPAAVLVGALAVPAQAAPADSTPSAQQLIARIARSGGASYSGTIRQTSDLGLPQLPSTGSGSASSDDSGILDLVTAPHTAKVYVHGRTQQRVQVLDQLAERDVIRDGSSVWIWDSKGKTAEHVVLASKKAATSAPATPAELATRILAELRKSSKVAVSSGGAVAGRPVDRLTLTPDTDQTLVGKVVVSVDQKTGVPLEVAVDARGRSGDAVSVGFADVSFSTPDASLFSFTPPKGAKVTTKELPARHPVATPGQLPNDPDATATPSATPTVSGSGWGAVVTLPSATLPKDVASDPLYGELTTPVAGGRALQTSLVSVLITDDGRILAGAVPIATLETAAQ